MLELLAFSVRCGWGRGLQTLSKPSKPCLLGSQATLSKRQLLALQVPDNTPHKSTLQLSGKENSLTFQLAVSDIHWAMGTESHGSYVQPLPRKLMPCLSLEKSTPILGCVSLSPGHLSVLKIYAQMPFNELRLYLILKFFSIMCPGIWFYLSGSPGGWEWEEECLRPLVMVMYVLVWQKIKGRALPVTAG